MATAVTGTSATTGAAPSTSGSAAAGGLDKDAFLKLLVAQLKFQNPMSPTDPSAFMAQTAQFAMVERLEEISRAQSEAGTWQRVLAGQSLLGRTVTGTTLGSPVSGLVTGLTVTSDGAVLELAGGRTLAVTDVETVGTVSRTGQGSTTG